MSRVAIVAGARTPIGKAGRAYRDVHPVDLLKTTFTATVNAAGITGDVIDRALVGCTHQMGDQAVNVGRNAWLAAGLTHMQSVLTLDAQCCSGQEVATLGAALIGSEQADLVMVGGVESLSRVASGSTFGDGIGNPYPPSLTDLWDMPHQGMAGERMARKYGVTREAADAYGASSHQRAASAWKRGNMTDEIVVIDGPDGPVLESDEGVRAGATPESAAALAPAFDPSGIITAASSSQLSDGAASILLASEKACEEYSLDPIAWITATASTGADPNFMMEGPIHATAEVLARADIDIASVDAFELHEAFAIPVLVWMERMGVPRDVVNVDGGAIALGHPFAASGTRQLLHLAHHLRRAGGGRGLQAMCGGGGLGSATVLEAP